MYCTNCAKEIDDRAAVCVGCNVPVYMTANYCYVCGKKLTPGAVMCGGCGVPVRLDRPDGARSRLAAGLLGIFLGVWGVHNFYLGYTSKATIQVLLGTVGVILFGLGPAASAIWGLIEGIMILTGSIDRDGKGYAMKQ